jgi:vacuolar-type H+-ATPase subunit E/Vma4
MIDKAAIRELFEMLLEEYQHERDAVIREFCTSVKMRDSDLEEMDDNIADYRSRLEKLLDNSGEG